MKRCKKCGVEKPENQFRVCRGYVRHQCRECDRKYMEARRVREPERYAAGARKWSKEHPKQRNDTKRKWRNRNPEKHRALVRKSLYGIGPEEFNILYLNQNGRCAICVKKILDGSGRNGLVVDHCHRTGRVRGLLCAACNRGLGAFMDEPNRLCSAAVYLLQKQS